ncbi:MAG: membrane protein [Chloroflexota bacterium]
MARSKSFNDPPPSQKQALKGRTLSAAGRRVRTRDVVHLLTRSEIAQPLGVFGLTRALFLALTYFGIILSASRLHDATHPSFLHQFFLRWQQWDTVWYIQIAQRGYAWHRAAGTSPAAFFPLFPTLLRTGVVISHRSYIFVALALSNACFLGALFYLWRLTRWELDEKTAGRTILYIAVFPTALFFFAGYSESLFLFLSVAAFYSLRRRQWIRAGMFVGLASVTRITGILLLLPFAYEYARYHNFRLRDMVFNRSVVGLVLAPSGIVVFMLYLGWQIHDPLGFSHGQAAWQKAPTFELWVGFLETARHILLVDPAASFFQAHNVIEGGLGGLALLASILATRKLPASYALYLAAFWLLTLSEPAVAGGYPVPLVSLSRYVLSLFPVFMYFGLMGNRTWFHNGYLVLAPAGLAVLTVQFLNGGWVV